MKNSFSIFYFLFAIFYFLELAANKK